MKDIMSVTGHKNVVSLDSYINEPNKDERAKMSHILSNFGQNDTAKENQMPNTQIAIATTTAQENIINVQSNI